MHCVLYLGIAYLNFHGYLIRRVKIQIGKNEIMTPLLKYEIYRLLIYLLHHNTFLVQTFKIKYQNENVRILGFVFVVGNFIHFYSDI